MQKRVPEPIRRLLSHMTRSPVDRSSKACVVHESASRLTSAFAPLGIVLLATGVAHGIVVLTDYVIWDGWITGGALSLEQGHDWLTRMAVEAGRPMDARFFELFSLVRDRVVAAKIAGVIAWGCLFVAASYVLRRLAKLPDVVAVAVAATAATMPVFELLGDLCMWMYTACACLLWGGLALVAAMRTLRGVARTAVRLVALAVLFVAMNLNSQLVFFYALGLVIAALRYADLGWRKALMATGNMGLRNIDFAILPIAFWLWKTTCTPTHGYYAAYNAPSFEIGRLVWGYLISLTAILFGIPWAAISSQGNLLVGVGAAMAAVFWVSKNGHDDQSPACAGAAPAPSIGGRQLQVLFAGGFLLLLAGIFPYVVVGQPLASWGWQSRTCVLCPIPIAMMIVGAAIAGANRILPLRPRSWLVAVCFVGGIAAADCSRRYLKLQGFGVKQMVVVDAIKKVIAERSPCVIQLRDHFRIPETIGYYPPSIWTLMTAAGKPRVETFVFETAAIFPDQRVIGRDGIPSVVAPTIDMNAARLDQLIEETAIPYMMENVPRRGRQTLLVVSPVNPIGNGVDLGLEYLRRRFFAGNTIDAFSRGLVTVESKELQSLSD